MQQNHFICSQFILNSSCYLLYPKDASYFDKYYCGINNAILVI